MRRVTPLIAILALVAITACNSTNRQDTAADVTEASAAPGATGTTGAREDAAASGAPGAAGSGSGGTATGGGPGGVGSGGPGAGTGSSTVAGARDTTPIRLGFITIDLKGAETVVSGLGTQVSFGDGKKQSQAIVDELNSKGGIAGRKILPFYAEVNVASGGDGGQAAYLAACENLTNDNNVFAILTPLNVTSSFVECAADHRVPVINVSFNPGDNELFRLYKDYFFSPSLMSLDRGSKLMLQNLRAAGGLGAGVKVGLVTAGDDQQTVRVSNRTVKPLLRSWKVPFVEAVVQNDADISNAVLRFNTDDVDRVIFEAPNGIGQILFMNQAQNQRFFPKYSVWDPDSPRFVSETAPQEQVVNMSGIGALPLSDVPPAEYKPQPAEQRCIDILNRRGYETRNRNSNLTSILYCEAIYVFAEAAKRVPVKLTVDNWRAAYRAVGTAYAPVSTFRTDFGNGRNDGATHYRKLAYVQACRCMRFSGPSVFGG